MVSASGNKRGTRWHRIALLNGHWNDSYRLARRSPLAHPVPVLPEPDGLVRQHLALGEGRLDQHRGAPDDAALPVLLGALRHRQHEINHATLLLNLEQVAVRVRKPFAAELGAAL